jgi:Tol biopolymer transport system component
MTLQAGAKLGPYEIKNQIGEGGMGEVYLARDTRLGRDVAITVRPQHLASTPDARTRFEREARAISALNHPNICTLHDVGHQDGVDFLVMEHLEGQSLAARLATGALPMDEVLKVGTQIADALDKAHRQGLVHRDLKPGNIMLTRSGAKLLDFGLARATVAGTTTDLSQSPTSTRALTTEGAIVGTFQYMSPEQLEGGEADARSDIFSFGAVLYEMATGHKAFDGRSQATLIAAIITQDPPSVTQAQPLASPALDRVIQTCLAKNAENRYQSAHDVKLQLEWVAEGGSLAGVPAPVAARRRGRERAMTVVAAVAMLGVVALATLLVLRRPAQPRIVRFEVSPPSSLQFLDSPRISPDGRHIAYNATDSTGVSRVWIRSLEAMTARALAGTDGAGRPFWSPDSRFLGFFAGGKLKKVDVTGAPPVTLCDAPTGADGAWSKDGVILYDGRATDPIMRVPATGGVPVAEVVTDSSTGSAQVGWPEFLPDGKHFFFLAIGAQTTLKVGALGSEKVVEVGPCESRVQYVRSGHIVFSRGGTLVAQRFSAGSLKLQGEPVPIAEQVTTDPVGAADFSLSENGTLAYSTRRAQVGQLFQLDRVGRHTANYRTPGGIMNLALSPDGRRIAIRVLDANTRSRDIWLLDIDRDITSRFTFDPRNENYPVWSPTGDRVAYYAEAPTNGEPGIYMKNSSGAGQAQMVASLSAESRPACWSADGAQIIYEVDDPARARDVLVVGTVGGEAPRPVLQTKFDEHDARLSPDGRWLAYVSNESGRDEVYVQTYPEPTGKWQASTSGGSYPEWRGDGSEMYYVASDQQLMAVPIQTTPNFMAGLPRGLFNARVLFPGAASSAYAVSKDGSTFYIIEPAGGASLPVTNVVLNWPEALKQR